MSPRKTAVYCTAAILASAACVVHVEAQPPGLTFTHTSEGAGTKSTFLNGKGQWWLSELNDVHGDGTIVVAAGATAVTGTGTFFTSELQVGSRLLTATDALIGVVAAINSDTSLVLQSGAAVGNSGAWQYQVKVTHDYLWDATTGNTYWAIGDEDCTVDNYLTINNPTTGAKTTYEFETVDEQCADPYLKDPCKHLKPDPKLGEQPWQVYECHNPASVVIGSDGRQTLGSASFECAMPMSSGFTPYEVAGTAFKNQFPSLTVPSNTTYVYANGNSLCLCQCPYTQQDKSEYISSVLRETFPTECVAADYVDTMITAVSSTGVPQQAHTYVGTYSQSSTSLQKFRFFLIGDNVADNTMPTGSDPFDINNPFPWWDDYYVEISTRTSSTSTVWSAYTPFSIAGYKIDNTSPNLPVWSDLDASGNTVTSPFVWALPYTCDTDIEPDEPVVTTTPVANPVPSTVSVSCCTGKENNPSTATENCCLANNVAPALTWPNPSDAEKQIKSWHHNEIIWDNNPGTNSNTNGGVDWNDVLKVVGYVGVKMAGALGPAAYWAAKGLNSVLQMVSDGIPQNRLWGTNWCARGNEFTAYTRLFQGSSNDLWGRTDTSKRYGNACAGESPKSGSVVGPAGSGTYAGSSIVTIRDKYIPNPKVERKKRKNLTLYNVIKGSSVVPAVLRDYTIGPSVRQDLLGPAWAAVELPSANVFDASGKLTKAAQRLARCRSIPNWIDTDFKLFTGGLQSVGRNLATGTFPISSDMWDGSKGTINGKNNLLSFDSAYYANWPYNGVVAKRAFDNVYEVAVTQGCKTQGCSNFDTWCRQHDVAPIAYTLGNKKGSAASKGTCHADGRALFLARQFNSNYAHLKFANMLFGTFGQQPCLNLKLKCVEKKKAKCRNFALVWKKSWGAKYHAGKKEGKVFSGPIGRNDLWTETTCMTLRTPGEGVDGKLTPRIGNGICNCEFNNEWWGYDGGDCCAATCRRPSLLCHQASGTITISSATPKAVVGTGSSFNTQFAVGHKLYVISSTGVSTLVGTIASIASATSMTLVNNALVFPTAKIYVKDPNNNVAPSTCTQQDTKCDLSLPTGTVTLKSGTADILGTGTSFLSWFDVGHKLTAANGQVIGTIASIASNTVLTLTAIPSATWQTTLQTPTAIMLDTTNSPFVGFNCKQPGCPGPNGINVAQYYSAQSTGTWELDGHTAKNYLLSTTTQCGAQTITA